MGVVYEAERLVAKGPDPVAIKVLATAFADDADFITRFAREADALIRLRHPHLIEVYEKGEYSPPEGGPSIYYFVMERFEGEDLRSYCQGQKLSVSTVLAIVQQAAAGLAHAHKEGIVHRDIKPGNILVRGDPAKDGLVKVVDFGVAQLASPGQTLTSLTHSNLILGTLNYMSPEQRIDASKIDHRADVYALGVVAYELLTGSLPLGAFEAPSELRPELSKGTDRALMAALRRDPEQRPSSVQHFARALELACQPSRAPRNAGLALLAMGVLGAGGWLASTQIPPQVSPVAKQSKNVPDPVPKASTPSPTQPEAQKETPPAWTPTPEFDRLAAFMKRDGDLVRKLALPLPVKKSRPKSKRRLPSPKSPRLKAD